MNINRNFFINFVNQSDKKSNMALTNYRAYKWLIETLDNARDQKYGMTLKELNQDYKMHRYKIYGSGKRGLLSPEEIEKDYKWYKDPDNKKTDKDYSKKDDLSYKTLINWRNAIWKEFGLVIWHPIVKGKEQKSYYVIYNPEVLDEVHTLRKTLDHLAEDEERGYDNNANLAQTGITNVIKKYQDDIRASMSFVSLGSLNVNYLNPQLGNQYMEEPEMVSIIQFAMTIGEALVMNYSKVMTIEDKNRWNYTPEELFVLEPQQLLFINGRWYVAGNIYPYRNPDNHRIAVYDVEKIKLYDGDKDLETPSYNLQEGFDIYNLLPSDWNEHFNPDNVISLYLRAAGFFLDKNPFCEAQEKIEDYKSALYNLYKVFLKADEKFFVQYIAYGDELLAYNPYTHCQVERTSIDISDEQLSYLRNIRNLDYK